MSEIIKKGIGCLRLEASDAYSLLALLFLGFFLFAPKAEAFTATGTLESAVFDVGYGATWQSASWAASTTASSTLAIKVRTATTADMSSASAWSSCAAITSGTDISSSDCASDGHRYFQYLALLEADYISTSSYASPELLSFEIAYEAVGVLESSVYDTLAGDTELLELRWSESLPASTNILAQLRSSANASTWTDWLGPDGTSATYFSDQSGGDSIPAIFADGSGERYFQYRLILDSGGVDLPLLSDVAIDFFAQVPLVSAINPPMVGSNASGTVALSISGANFLSGASLALRSGGSNFSVTNPRVVSSSQINFDLDTSQLYGGPMTIVINNPNGTSVENSDFYVQEYRGTFESAANELPNFSLGALSWNASTSATNQTFVRVRTDTSADMSSAPTWSSCPLLTSGQDISATACVSDGESFLQYRLEMIADFGSSSAYHSPEFFDLSLDYSRYIASGTLVSSPFDTASDANAWRSLRWTADTPAGTEVTMELRTAPDNGGSPGTWTAWLGPYEGVSYRNALGTGPINLIHNDGSADRWLQYRVTLWGGVSSPIVKEISLEYGDKSHSSQIIEDSVIFKEGVIMR